eukprot:2912510-Rhodomonas_salina.1
MNANVKEYLNKGREVNAEFQAYPLVTCAVAPHAPYTCGEEGLKLAKEFADEIGVPFHIHLQETAGECEDWSKAQAQAERPIATLNRIGLVNERLIAVHVTQATDEEIKILAAAG